MWYNPIIKALLNSPIHWFIGGSIMLITVAGRKTGRKYTLPVSYRRGEEDEPLTVFSRVNRTWWRNLQEGAAVTVRVRGKNYTAHAEVAEVDEETRMAYLKEMYSRMMKEDEIKELSPKLVMIDIWLDEA
jgi:deazaflavin-dependent oxidoreductase (nitroreductase family)